MKRHLVGRVVRSLEIQVAKVTNRQKNSSEEESSPLRYSCAVELVSVIAILYLIHIFVNLLLYFK